MSVRNIVYAKFRNEKIEEEKAKPDSKQPSEIAINSSKEHSLDEKI